MLPHWKQVIRPGNNTEYTRYEDGETEDIMETTLYADTLSHKFLLASGVERLRGRDDYETCKNIFLFVRDNIQYQADQPRHEKVKSPGALFSINRGDCKSYSVAEGALLRKLGIPFVFRFTAYSAGDFTHVYIVARPKGERPVIMDAVYRRFDQEKPYWKKKDIAPKPQRATLAGIGKAAQSENENWFGKIVVAFFVGLLLEKLFKKLR